MRVSPARAAAFDVLHRIESEGAFSSILLPIFEERLSERDRGLCHEIVLGVLRRRLYLDAIIDALAGCRRLDTEVRVSLRIGLFQMIFLDRVPSHSAINESVELIVRARKSSARAFVNAILRRYQREEVPLTFSDDLDRISIETSHPRWLVERWSRQFGHDAAVRICEANNCQPPIAFRVLDPSVLESLRDEELVTPSVFSTDAYSTPRSAPAILTAAAEGRIYLQETGSQVIGDYIAGVAGKNVIDVCAAPGGKTLIIAERPRGLVVAGDRSDARVRLLRDTCNRFLRRIVSIVQYDAEIALPFRRRSLDVVFVDAPCTGTGTIAHNPEIRYSVTEERIAEASRKQLRILENASELVSEGGRLVYSTCSLERDENEHVCDVFIKDRDEFETVTPGLPPAFITGEGNARMMPHLHKMDGYFVAEFRRK